MDYKMIKNNNDTINHKFNNDNIINLKENGKYRDLNLCEANIVEMINVEDLNLKLLDYEYHTIVGRIDILCENNNKKLIPIEVKLGTAGDSAIGQILGYMKVMNTDSGVIIAQDFSSRVKFLADDYNIKLIYYIVFEEYNKEENKTLIYNGLINEFKNEDFLLLKSNFVTKINQEIKIEQKLNNNEKLDVINTVKLDDKNTINIEEKPIINKDKLDDKNTIDIEEKPIINKDKLEEYDKNITHIETTHNNWNNKYETWKIENQDEWEQQLRHNCKLKEKKRREEENIEDQKRQDKWLQSQIDKIEDDKNKIKLIEGGSETKKEIKSNLSRMEQIRLKSIDPDFINECDVVVKYTCEERREIEYTTLLKRRVEEEVELRNQARIGFAEICGD